MNVLIYSRVSSIIQDYERQISNINTYCQKNDYTIITEFCEKESGKKKQRQELTNCLNYCKENQHSINYLIVDELSRLGRTREVLETVETLNDLKIGLISIKENLTTLNPDRTVNHTASMIIGVMASLNSYELETMRYRSKTGMLRSAQIGRAGGGALLPYGFTKNDNKMLIINEEEAEVVKRIFNLYNDGTGRAEICKILNREGIQTRFQKSLTSEIEYKKKNYLKTKTPDTYTWVAQTIHKILTNPIYIGKRRFKGNLFDCPSIVSEELFNNVQNRLKNNLSKKDNGKTKNFYLLGGIKIICGQCQENYYPYTRANRPDKKYICMSTRLTVEKKCNYTGISTNKLNNGVWYVARRTDELIQHINESLKSSDIMVKLRKTEEQINLLYDELKGLEENERFLVDMVMNKKISQMVFIEKNDKNNFEIEKVKKKIEQNNSLIKELEKYSKKTMDIDARIRAMKDDKQMMKDFLTDLIDKMYVYPVHNLNVGTIKNEKSVLIKMFLKDSPKPLYFVISQRSDFIIRVDENEFDFTNYHLNPDVLQRKDYIRHDIK